MTCPSSLRRQSSDYSGDELRTRGKAGLWQQAVFQLAEGWLGAAKPIARALRKCSPANLFLRPFTSRRAAGRHFGGIEGREQIEQSLLLLDVRV